MEQYISKSALVAEIERLRGVQPFGAFQPKEQNKADWLAGKLFTLASLETFIDTLEVKEVDLEEELPVSNSLTEEGLFTFKDGSQAIIAKID